MWGTWKLFASRLFSFTCVFTLGAHLFLFFFSSSSRALRRARAATQNVYDEVGKVVMVCDPSVFLIESQASGFRRARTQTGNSASSTSGNNFPPRSLPCGNDVNPLPVPSCRSLGCAAASGSGSHSRTGTNDTLEYLFPSDVHDWCVAGRSEGNLNYAV